MAEEVTFARSLYLPAAVEAAVAAYAEHAQIQLTPSGDSIVAAIAPIGDIDPQLLVDSFCNHVLYETIVALRHAATQEPD